MFGNIGVVVVLLLIIVIGVPALAQLNSKEHEDDDLF